MSIYIIWAVVITVYLGVHYVYPFLTKTKAVRDVHTPDEILRAAVTNTPLACMVWTERHFENKLVEAGIMNLTDMTVCEFKDCLNCKPTRQAIQEAEDAKDMEAKRARWALEHKARTEAIAAKAAMVKTANERREEKAQKFWEARGGMKCFACQKWHSKDVFCDARSMKNNLCKHQIWTLEKTGWCDDECLRCGKTYCTRCRAWGIHDNTLYGRLVCTRCAEQYEIQDGAGNVVRTWNPAGINCVTCDKPGIHTHTLPDARIPARRS